MLWELERNDMQIAACPTTNPAAQNAVLNDAQAQGMFGRLAGCYWTKSWTGTGAVRQFCGDGQAHKTARNS